MKTYDKLSKAEREKLNTFLQYVSITNLKFLIVYLVGCIFVAIGIPLMLIFTEGIIEVTGFLMIMIGMMYVFVGISEVNLYKKKMFLIFGYKDSIEDVFGITRADIKKVKINREVKWNWRKEE